MYSLDATGQEVLPVSIAPVIRRVGVVGLGTMGAGIAQVSAQAGFETVGREVSEELCEKARGSIEHYVGRAVEKGKATAEERDATLGRLSFTTELADLAECDLVIEAIVEELEPKREVFAELDRIVRPDAILASNTSAIPIHAIAEATEHPERVIGMHFFNPAPLLPLVEIIRAETSSDEALNAAFRVGRAGGQAARPRERHARVHRQPHPRADAERVHPAPRRGDHASRISTRR